MGWDWAFSLQPFGELWRARRRLFQASFDGNASRRFYPHQTKACHNLLRRLMDAPKDWAIHLRQ